MKRRILALVLAGIMALSLCACDGGETGGGTSVSSDIPEGKQIPDDAVLDITVASHGSWPYQEDWKAWQYIRESIGGTLNINAVPTTDFGTKYPLLMATRDIMPDVIAFQGASSVFYDYCEQGAYKAFDDYEEYMTDYNAFWESRPESDQWMKTIRKSQDGKIYYTPTFGLDRYTNLRTWLYRKDIFDEHGLKAPETIEDLYQVSKKLKEIYPTSYPFCLRSGYSNINVFGCSWKPNFRYNVYYDFENEKFSFGAREDVMYDIVVFLNKMVSEGLVPADFLNINTASWEELVTTNRGFIMPEYQIRIDYFNGIAREHYPNFNLTAMTPPHADNGIGLPKTNKYNQDPSGYAVCNTGDEESIVNSMRYVNWFYSDEAAELLSWGKEGETYEVKDGERVYILPNEQATAQTEFGFKTMGAYVRIDPSCIDAGASKEQAATTDFIIDNMYPHLDPTLYMQLSSEDSAKAADYNTSITTFVDENIAKFVLGQRPISEWETFQKELSELPIDDLLAVYEKAYENYK